MVKYLEEGILEEEPDYHARIQLCIDHALSFSKKTEGEKNTIRQMRWTGTLVCQRVKRFCKD